MTLNELVYNIRSLRYGGVEPDDYQLSDRQVAFWIRNIRALLIKQDLDKNRMIPEQIVQDLGCLSLECVDSAECCQLLGIESGEYIKRTEVLPVPLNFHFATDTATSLFTYVGTVYGESIEFTSEAIVKRAKHKKYTGLKRRAFYKNGRIYITNANLMDIVRVRGIFENPEDVAKFNTCDGESCFTYDSPYPLTEYHASMLNDLIIKTYLQYIINPAVQQDATNNTLDDPKPESIR